MTSTGTEVTLTEPITAALITFNHFAQATDLRLDDFRPRDVRGRYMSQHLDFLSRHASVIRAAGPLCQNEDSGAGGLWLVEADTPEAVERLVQNDPFWSTGLRRSVRVLIWKRVFADGTRP